MQIGFWHSSLGGSPLMVGLQRGLETLGHNVVTAHPAGEYDLIVMFNQIAHDPTYRYPDFPIRSSPLAFIDGAEYGYFKRFPGIINCYANAFSPGSVSHDTKNAGQQARLRLFLEGKSFPYFIREKSKFIQWPETYHGVNYPLYKLSECHDRPNREEYLNRSVPFWQSWGASHPWRWGITNALRAAGYECLVLEEDTGNGPLQRIPQDQYFPRMRGARCCCSFDGYGSSSFRLTEVLCRTTLLQGPLLVDFPYPLSDGVNCVEFGIQSTGEEFLSTDIVEKVQSVLDDPERAYSIYQAGYDHCMTYFTEEALARYILEVVNAHDYSQPTPLEIV